MVCRSLQAPNTFLGLLQLAAGAELKLPLWLAESLVTKRMATASLPKTHNTGIRGHLTNDPASMNFASNPYIYELGAVVATLTGDTALPPLLSSIFTARFAKLWDHSRNWSTEDTASATAEMCNSEKKRTSSNEVARKLQRKFFGSTVSYSPSGPHFAIC